MKVLWITNIPSPYRVDFFNELGKKCDLTVIFEKEFSSERDKSWADFKIYNFKAIFLRGISIGVAESFCPSIIFKIKKDKYDRIVITNFSDLTGIFAILYLKLFKIGYEIESDGAFPNTGNRIKDHIKRFIIKGAERYFSTAKLHDQYYIKYGAEEKNISRFHFSSLKQSDLNKADEMKMKGKRYYKDILGIKEEKIVISVGRFIYIKGYDVLLKAAKDLDNNIGIYIIGGNPTQEYIYLKEKLKLDNVHFVGFKKKDELAEYYCASDLFLLPTREDIWGLVINEAMAFSLPIITTNRCIAGIELVDEGKNGYIIPVDDADAIYKAIMNIISSDSLLSSFGEESRKKIEKYTIEEMVSQHLKYWES